MTDMAQNRCLRVRSNVDNPARPCALGNSACTGDLFCGLLPQRLDSPVADDFLIRLRARCSDQLTLGHNFRLDLRRKFRCRIADDDPAIFGVLAAHIGHGNDARGILLQLGEYHRGCASGRQ